MTTTSQRINRRHDFSSFDDCDRFNVAAGTTRFWYLGDVLRPGDRIGTALDGAPVQAASSGRVAHIQYDIDKDEIILFVEPLNLDD